MKELQLFSSAEFGEIRTTEFKGNPMFSLIDVCRALEIKNPSQAKTRLNRTGVITNEVGVITGKKADGTEVVQRVPMTFVNESNLYKLIFQSRKPEAEKFSEWVTEEVLPAIRRTGGYIPVNNEMSDAEIMARALVVAQKTIEDINHKIDELKPKAEFADAVGETKSVILIRDLAKLICRNGYEIGERRLYQWMRVHGYICKGSTKPTQKAIEGGWLVIVEQVAYRGDGQIHLTTKVTGKGQQYFIRKFIGGKGK